MNTSIRAIMVGIVLSAPAATHLQQQTVFSYLLPYFFKQLFKTKRVHYIPTYYYNIYVVIKTILNKICFVLTLIYASIYRVIK